MTLRAWKLLEPGRPLEYAENPLPEPGRGEALVEVAGCGVCHTDLAFFEGHVRSRGSLPVVLGHEISGTVIAAGEGAGEWAGRDVLVSAVIPCGECDLCRAGRSNICRAQVMPGNDLDGGFASHVLVDVRGLTAVPALPEGHGLADLAVVSDAVTTPLQAVRRAGVGDDDLAIVVGAGGVGTYAVQIAAASGASVVAVDIDASRLERLRDHGASATVDAEGCSARDVRDQVRARAKDLGFDRRAWKIFECSGTPGGQEAAFGLLVPAATLAIVGFTPQPVTLRLSNLMAFDADAFGSWGCPPERYSEALELVADRRISLLPFIEKRPLDSIEAAFADAAAGRHPGRIVLTP